MANLVGNETAGAASFGVLYRLLDGPALVRRWVS